MSTSEGLALIHNGWYKNAHRYESPNFNLRPQGINIDSIVIHNISLPPKQFGGTYIQDFFLNKLDHSAHPFFQEIKGLEVSSHCLISREGDTSQFVSFEHRAWHAGASEYKGRKNFNDFSIGIELEGTDDLAFTDAQYDRLVELTRQIMNTYPNIVCENIVGHSDIAPGRKTDPGKYFDWDRYFSGIQL